MAKCAVYNPIFKSEPSLRLQSHFVFWTRHCSFVRGELCLPSAGQNTLRPYTKMSLKKIKCT